MHPADITRIEGIILWKIGCLCTFIAVMLELTAILILVHDGKNWDSPVPQCQSYEPTLKYFSADKLGQFQEK